MENFPDFHRSIADGNFLRIQAQERIFSILEDLGMHTEAVRLAQMRAIVQKLGVPVQYLDCKTDALNPVSYTHLTLPTILRV